MDLMPKIIKAIENENSILLEAPTGIGKTRLMILSAIFWLDRMKSKYPENYEF
jgi:Rad3-related DNA helicase